MGVMHRRNNNAFCLIHTDKVSGGISTWRKSVFDSISFDTKNNLHVTEDFDFSTRVARFYGGKESLCICTKAQLWHNYYMAGRPDIGGKQKRKLEEIVVYYRIRQDWDLATFSFVWLLIGLFIESCFLTIVKRSPSVFLGYFVGLRLGFEKTIK